MPPPLVKTMLHSLKTWKTLKSTLHGDAGFFIACGHTIFINLVFSLWFSLSLTRRNLFIWFRDKGRFKSLFWNCIYTSINGHLSVCIYGIDCNLTRQKSLQNNRLPKFTNAKLPDLLTQSFTSNYFPKNCRAIWVHPSKIILSPKFASTKFY